MKYLELLTLLQVIRLCIGDSDWIVDGNYEYKIIGDASNFKDAKTRCEEIDSTLSMIKTKDIQDFFESNIIEDLNQDMYLGMERISHNIFDPPSNFIWLDGDNVGSNYENFFFGQPYIGENCGILSHRYKNWYGDDCKTERSFVCQREVAVTSTYAIITTSPEITSTLFSTKSITTSPTITTLTSTDTTRVTYTSSYENNTTTTSEYITSAAGQSTNPAGTPTSGFSDELLIAVVIPIVVVTFIVIFGIAGFILWKKRTKQGQRKSTSKMKIVKNSFKNEIETTNDKENEYLEVKKITNQEKNLFQANKNEKGKKYENANPTDGGNNVFSTADTSSKDDYTDVYTLADLTNKEGYTDICSPADTSNQDGYIDLYTVPDPANEEGYTDVYTLADPANVDENHLKIANPADDNNDVYSLADTSDKDDNDDVYSLADTSDKDDNNDVYSSADTSDKDNDNDVYSLADTSDKDNDNDDSFLPDKDNNKGDVGNTSDEVYSLAETSTVMKK